MKIDLEKYYKKILNFNEFFEKEITKKDLKFIDLLKSIINDHLLLVEEEFDKNNNGQKVSSYQNSYLYYPYNNKVCNCHKKNIVLFAHELSRTGAPMVVLDTAKALLKNGYFVLVVTPKNGPLLIDFLEYGIPVLIEEDMSYVFYKRMDISSFYKYVLSDTIISQFDVSIFVSLTFYNEVKRYMNTNNKILWWIHEGKESYSVIGDRVPKNLSKNINVYYGGNYALDEARKCGFYYPAQVLNYGVTDEFISYKKPKNDKIIFLLAGTIGVRKGQLVLLEAIKNLNNDIQKNTEFIFVGDTYDNDQAGEIVKQELVNYSSNNDNIKMIKSISREELYELYKKIDVLIVPSIDDPMPVVATENFMQKNICLCSDRTGTSYYIKDGINGFVFKNGDYKELSEKILFIINNRNNLDKIKEKGREIFESVFDMKIFEKKIVTIIEKEI